MLQSKDEMWISQKQPAVFDGTANQMLYRCRKTSLSTPGYTSTTARLCDTVIDHKG